MKYFYTHFFCLLSLSAALPINLLDAPPLPGRTGVYTDPNTKLTTFHYGDDDIPEHMNHLQRNQAAHHENHDPMGVVANTKKNRKEALKNIATPPPHPVTKYNRVRDEKLPAMLNNPNHATTTTVEYLPEYESRLESNSAKTFKAAIKNGNGKGQLRPNPGWLPIDPSQRRGHEAPARLNSQVLVGPRPDPNERKPPRTDGKGEAPKSGPSNLRPGRVMPVWQPSTKEDKASHVGAPGHVKDAEKRYPPRPQNLEHYNKQLQQKKDEEAKKKVASKDTKLTPPQPKDEAKKQKAAANLLEFEKKFGPAKKGEKVKEAPARLQKQSSSHPPARPAGQPATRPPSPARPPSPPRPKAQGSSSKPVPKPPGKR